MMLLGLGYSTPSENKITSQHIVQILHETLKKGIFFFKKSLFFRKY